ncbi:MULTISPECIES: CPBP family intramembrane glutamic endopeptidase [Sporosarcina]|uniref:CPBP family intramembrane glutamic endopeptidase n=1 Tax=Sporosarcina TaxID=1569 RepID=UPI00129AF6FB|nr:MULTISPECIES: type II CAAX endopeptidase family protein [Sporosarcina]GKV64695.1 CAAX amino protease [Sporosarcina sp. NCCP-2331]GLB54805.1 CAAX amino protease [Sporosarcina sp. NCCP-2378]
MLKTSPWGKKELLQLLFLVLVLVPIFIEYLLMNYLTDLFQNDLYSGTLIGFIMSIIFMTGLYVLALRPKRLGWTEVGLNRFSRSYWGPIVGWTILLLIASVLLVILMSFFGIGVENSKTESVQTHLSPLAFLIAFVSACIISPVYEEIFYRGFLYRWFRGRYGIALGMAASSLIFMLVHIPNYNVLPATFVSGLVFSWTYEKTGSVVPGMIIHGTFNAIALFLTAFA